MVVLNTAGSGAGRLPSDWQIKVNHGRPDISVCKDDDVSCVHLKSVKASFALEKGVDVDPAQMPYLTWRWKVTQSRRAEIFAAPPPTIRRPRSWSLSPTAVSSATSGTAPRPKAPWIPPARFLWCAYSPWFANRAPPRRTAGSPRAATWPPIIERAYGKSAPHVKGIRIQINSQHTAYRGGELLRRSGLPQHAAINVSGHRSDRLHRQPSGGETVARPVLPVRALVRRIDGEWPCPTARCDLVTGEGLEEALDGVDTVIHLAGATKALAPEDYYAG